VDFTSDSIAMFALISVLIVDRILLIFKQRGLDLHLIAAQINDIATQINVLHEKHGPGSEIERKIDDLHRWHDVVDSEGVRLWYVRRSLEKAIEKLAENIEVSTKIFTKMDRRLDAIECGLISCAEDRKEFIRAARG